MENLSFLSEKILHKLYDKTAIQEALVVELLNEVRKAITKPYYDALPKEFYLLASYVENLSISLQAERADSATAMLYGKLWAIISLARLQDREISILDSIEEDAIRYRQYRDVLMVIQDNSGITHKQLTEKYNDKSGNTISPSRLSQIISTFPDGRYFMTRKLGREKYYYLTALGEKLIDAMPAPLSTAQKAFSYENLVAQLVQALSKYDDEKQQEELFTLSNKTIFVSATKKSPHDSAIRLKNALATTSVTENIVSGIGSTNQWGIHKFSQQRH